MESELYKVTAGYHGNDTLFVDNCYETYAEAQETLSNPWPFDWMRYDVVEDNKNNRIEVEETKQKYIESSKRAEESLEALRRHGYNLSEGP